MKPPTVIVLASGRGLRFTASGGQTHKLQARLAGKSVLEHTLGAVRASGLPWHLEDGEHAGMGDAIAAAVQATWQTGAGGWLILPGDLPLIQAQTLRLLAAALATSDVVVPRFQGRRGHPVGFRENCGPELSQLKGDRGAALVVNAYQAIELIVNDKGCVFDIDTLDDLSKAERWLHQRASPTISC